MCLSTVHVRYVVKRYGMGSSERRLMFVAVHKSFISSLELSIPVNRHTILRFVFF